MLDALRSRCLSVATLAAFVLVQPAALCAALCLVEHHAEVHAMASGHRGTSAVGAGACHGGMVDAVQHEQAQVLSPMAPARPVAIAAAAGHRTEAPRDLAAVPAPVSRSTDPPPPRSV